MSMGMWPHQDGLTIITRNINMSKIRKMALVSAEVVVLFAYGQTEMQYFT
ncbi:hypothetical protein Poly41_49460 [Novipirellula artificiosorum]|uniref:Uncharacterized protein n=1 Tax=Novipirellula artificiosorum TaxID=2528016 RepID=A0A5C6DBI2_9BACT|nr:hypothetical protein Poly41_49460 [Novipirellula artificiosorum]